MIGQIMCCLHVNHMVPYDIGYTKLIYNLFYMNQEIVILGFAMGRAKPDNLWVGPGLGRAWAQILGPLLIGPGLGWACKIMGRARVL